jgi:hypothetical protein
MTFTTLKLILSLVFINALYLFLLGTFLKESTIDLKTVSSIKGEISEVGIDTFRWNSSRLFPRQQTVYYFKINHSPYVFYFPYLEKNATVYKELNKNLPVSIYFKKQVPINRENIHEIIQLEKENKILLSKENPEMLNRILSILIFLAIIFTNWITYLQLKKAKI